MSWRTSSWSTYNGNCVAVAAEWRKPSLSFANGNCVEAAASWRKAQAGGGNGACAETASCRCGVRVRDSKDPDGPRLTFSRAEWAGFTAAIKAGEFA